jgi:hypothetical protein
MSKDDKDLKIGDILKKVVNTSVNAAFMTEDAVKGIIGELPLPKDIVNGLLQNAKASKEEFVSSIKNEFRSYLDKVDLSKEIDRVLDNYDIEVNAKVKFNRKATKNVSKKSNK